MNKIDEIRRILADKKHELRARFHVKNIGIFGSYVRGENADQSDLDILVDFDQPVGWEVVDLHEFLEAQLGMKVDLVTKGAVTRNPRLWKSIKEDLVNV